MSKRQGRMVAGSTLSLMLAAGLLQAMPGMGAVLPIAENGLPASAGESWPGGGTPVPGADIARDEDASSTMPHLSVWYQGKPLRDGYTYTVRDRLDVRFEVPDGDTAGPGIGEDGLPDVGVFVRDTGRSKSIQPDAWMRGAQPGTYYCMVGDGRAGGLEDGAYEVYAKLPDAPGEEPPRLIGAFRVDVDAPRVAIALPDDASWPREGTCVFANDNVVLDVRIADSSLDEDRTTVAGICLADLLEETKDREAADPAIDVEPVERTLDDAGRAVYRTKVVLHEGTHDVSGLVLATDGVGHTAVAGPATKDGPVERIVVDGTAPKITAAVRTRPAWEGPTDHRLVLFAEPVTLQLAFEDASGIASVALDDKSAGRTLVVSEAKDRAGIPLGAQPLTEDTAITVADKAGNIAVWSLGALGAHSTARGTELVENQPVTCAVDGSVLPYRGHPQAMAVDVKAPKISLVGVTDASTVRDEQTIRVHVEDDLLDELVTMDPDRVVLSVTKDGRPYRSVSVSQGTAGDAGMDYVLTLPVRPTHADDGSYRVVASLTDLAGNASEELSRSFAVDTTAPVLQVSFDDAERGNERFENGLFALPRTAHITLREGTLSEEGLNKGQSPVHVFVQARAGRSPSDVAVSPWVLDRQGDAYTCDVIFPTDGTYELGVCGCDLAGNTLVGSEDTEVDGQGSYSSGEFVIDGSAPRVSMRYATDETPTNTYAGIDYFDHPVGVSIEVVDRNLDVRNTQVVASDGTKIVPEWKSSAPDASGEVTYTASVVYAQESSGSGEGSKNPRVIACDLAGNLADGDMGAFVVDQAAPVVERVWVGKQPSEAYDGGSDPYWFFSDDGDAAPLLNFELSDEYPLDAVWIEDPRGVYDTRVDEAHGKHRVSLALALHDGSGSDLSADNEAEFRRNVRVFVRDLAGNVRRWDLGRAGAVQAQGEGDDANVSVDGRGVFPQAIVRDGVAPKVALSGVEAGAYRNGPLTVHAALVEHNFDYICRYDPDRPVLHVRFQSGDSAQSVEEWDVPASAFTGARPDYALDLPLEKDGHYEVTASLTDLADNRSAEARIDAFTIDRTKPRINVSWDNHDVRNAMYYNASRTATVTVEEHNFDPGLVRVETTGRQGLWTHDGDRHTCKVVFDADATAAAPHTLRVSAQDRAGNAADEFEEEPFALDTHPPTVAFEKRVSDDDVWYAADAVSELKSGTAYAQAFVPSAVFADEAGLDQQSLTVRLVGKRDGEAASPLPVRSVVAEAPNRMVADWGNIGLAQGADGPYYEVGADDVYTLYAQVSDLAGNTSKLREVTFSVNRYGSNFFVEPMADVVAESSVGDDGPVLAQPPRIVVHEVNVSGVVPGPWPGGEDPHIVTKEYALATTPIRRTAVAEDCGYTVVGTTGSSALNPHEGWTEYTYTIQAGNFGEGSTSDFGDGGQGRYRVDVSSRDLASNNNTTARYWDSPVLREGQVADKSATTTFTLDEFGPAIESLDLPGPVTLADAYEASFVLKDEITNGDYLKVKVDGEPVEVREEGSDAAVGDNDAVRTGRFCFLIPAKSLFTPRSVEIQVSDYTGRQDRTQSVRAGGFRLTTMRGETLVACALTVLLAAVAFVIRRIWFVA